MSQICDRCLSPTDSISMSWFNTDNLCMECDKLEQLHPDYQKAKAVEMEQVESGNYNYEGIGLPDGYTEWARAKRVELAASREETGGVAQELINALDELVDQ